MTARPFRHPKTGVYYFRKGVPRDLRAAVGKWEEKRTLGTKDPAEACKRHREIAAAVEREWDALRCPPMALASQEDPKPRDLVELEQWLGAGLDGYAQSLGITISDASRPQILEAMNAACLQAAQALRLTPFNMQSQHLFLMDDGSIGEQGSGVARCPGAFRAA